MLSKEKQGNRMSFTKYYTQEEVYANIVQKLLLVPFTREQAENVADSLVGNRFSLNIFQKSKIDGRVYDYKGKVDGFCRLFKDYPDFRSKYVKAALRQPSLLWHSPDTIKGNIDSLVGIYASEGLTVKDYLKAALRQPQLFCLSAATVKGNIDTLVTGFAPEGLTTRDYLRAALRQPQLFYQSPVSIKANIDELVGIYASEGLTVKDYLKAALSQPPLFYLSPATVAGHIRFILKMFDSGLFKPSQYGAFQAILSFPVSLTFSYSNLRAHQWYAMRRENKMAYSTAMAIKKKDIMDEFFRKFPKYKVNKNG